MVVVVEGSLLLVIGVVGSLPADCGAARAGIVSRVRRGRKSCMFGRTGGVDFVLEYDG